MLRHARADYFVTAKENRLVEYKLDGQVNYWNQRDPPENRDGDTAVKYKYIFGKSRSSDLPNEEALRALGSALKRHSFAEAKNRKKNRIPESTSDVPAGYTYFGQFIFHDITAMLPGHKKIASGHWKSARTPALDLDSVLRAVKPVDDPNVAVDCRGLFRTGVTKGDWSREGEDLPRVPADDETATDRGRPYISDPRNDDFLTLAQLHLLMLRFYNALALRRGAREHRHDEAWWKETRREWVRHIQWITLYDYLPRIVDRETYLNVMRNGRRVVCIASPEDDEWFPIEVAGAVGRFGHSMIRDGYKPWNRIKPWSDFGVRQFMEFSYLNSPHRLREHYYGLPGEWTTNWFKLFDLRDGGQTDEHHDPFMARTIGTDLALCLFSLPHRITESRFPPSSSSHSERAQKPVQLATQSLLRGRQLRLAPAQRTLRKASEAIGHPLLQLHPRDIFPEEMKLAHHRRDLTETTPLWYYILREAECANGGMCLGPFAGRMIMETIHAAVAVSQDSILRDSNWRPVTGEQSFTMADMIRFCTSYAHQHEEV